MALRIVRSPVGKILSAIRDNPLRAAALGHSVAAYKLTAFVIAAGYAGLAGGLLGVLQGFMPPDAFSFDTSGQLVMQTAIGGVGTLFGPLLGATVWLFLRDFLQSTSSLGSAWKLVLGLVFVLLVCFLRRGLIGGLRRSLQSSPSIAPRSRPRRRRKRRCRLSPAAAADAAARTATATSTAGAILKATGLTKRYGGLLANSDIDFTVKVGELRGIIGPNGAGKSTFFKMLTCEVRADRGHDPVRGPGHHRQERHRRLPARPHQELPGQPAVHAPDGAREPDDRGTGRAARQVPPRPLPQSRRRSRASPSRSTHTLDLVSLTARADTTVSSLAYGEKRRLEIGLALATSPSLLLLDEPLAGMSPSERVATVKLLKSIAKGRTMIVIDHDMDSLFELVEWITVLQEGKVLTEGTPDQIKNDPVVQGSLSRRAARMSLLEVEGLNSYYGDSHILFDVSLQGRAQRGGGAARPQRRGQEHDLEEPDGRGDAALRQGDVRRQGRGGPEEPRRSPRPACSWSTRTGASSAA